MILTICLATANYFMQQDYFFTHEQFLFWIILLGSEGISLLLVIGQNDSRKRTQTVIPGFLLLMIDAGLTFYFMAIERYYFEITGLFFLFLIGPVVGILLSIISYTFPADYIDFDRDELSENNEVYDGYITTLEILRRQGAISEQEYRTEKARLISQFGKKRYKLKLNRNPRFWLTKWILRILLFILFFIIGYYGLFD